MAEKLLPPVLKKKPRIDSPKRINKFLSLYQIMAAYGHFSLRNTVQIFTQGNDVLYEMEKAINNAKKSVKMETYIYKLDLSGHRILDCLECAAARGVDVTFVYDGFGSLDLHNSGLMEKFKKYGGKAICYNELTKFNWISNLSSTILSRTHRKILVVDDEVSFTGGMNIGDEYFEKHHDDNSTFRDTQIKLTGPCVIELSDTVDETVELNKFKEPMHKRLKEHKDVKKMKNENPFKTFFRRRKFEKNLLNRNMGWLTRMIQKSKVFIQENLFNGNEKRKESLELLKEMFRLRKVKFTRIFTLKGMRENFKILREKQKEIFKKFKETFGLQKRPISDLLEDIKKIKKKKFQKKSFLKELDDYENKLEKFQKSFEYLESFQRSGFLKEVKMLKKSLNINPEFFLNPDLKEKYKKILKTNKMRKQAKKLEQKYFSKRKSETMWTPKKSSLEYKVNSTIRRRINAIHRYRGALFRGEDVSLMKERKYIPEELQTHLTTQEEQRKEMEKKMKEPEVKMKKLLSHFQQKLKMGLEKSLPRENVELMLKESSEILKFCVSHRKLKSFLKTIDSNPFYMRINPEKRNKFILNLKKITNSNVAQKKKLNHQKQLIKQSNRKIEKFFEEDCMLPHPVYGKKPKRMPKEKIKQEKTKLIKKLTSMLKSMDTNGVLGEDPFVNLKSFSKNRFKGYTRSYLKKFQKEEKQRAIDNNQIGVWVQVLRNSHNAEKKLIQDNLLKAMRLANDYIYITSPFINCTDEFILELCEAAENGIDVRILTSGTHGDVPMSRFASKHLYETFLKSGVKIYECSGTLHTKTIVIDDIYSMIGTWNMDFLSQNHLLEVSCFFLDNNTSKDVRKQFENDLKVSENFSLKDVQNLSVRWKFFYSTCHFLVKLFEMWADRRIQ
jgi:phosphatidylserine/phosphatidylglycerophosphate/cardiolipin synthase-like enzyme